MDNSKFIALVVVIFLVLVGGIWGCSSCEKVPAGHVGVKVYLLGKDKGVDSETLGVGRYYIGFQQELYLYPTFIQQYVFTKGNDGDSEGDEAFYFQNKDGVKCNFDMSIQAHANSEKVATLFQKYRDDMRDVLHNNLRNFLRDRIQAYGSEMSIEDLYSSKKVEMIKRVEADLRKEVEPYGITVDNVSLLSDIRFPEEVEQAIVAKIKSTQEALQRENELAKAEAEAKIQVTQAKAEAEALRMKQQTITPLMIQYEAVQKWDGKFPQVMGSNSVPFINMK